VSVSTNNAVPAEATADALREAVAHFNTLPLHDHNGRAAAHLEVQRLREKLAEAGVEPREVCYAGA
jgi:hypothetical protein